MRKLSLKRPHTRGRDVAFLQKRLNLHGYPCVVNGVFDSRTFVALKEFVYINLPGRKSIVADDPVWHILTSPPLCKRNLTEIGSLIVPKALSVLDFPFIWGGGSMDVGFDPLGLLMFSLQDSNLLFTKYGSETLIEFESKVRGNSVVGDLCNGDIVLYSSKMGMPPSSMGIYIGNRLVVGAFGGNKFTTSYDIAKKRNARVQIKNIEFRKHICGEYRLQCIKM